MSANSDLASIRERPGRNSIEVFSTCSQSKDVDKSLYLQNVADVARWSEEAGCKGILVYTDNSIADPWLVPFQNYKTNCPYLVGSYERVAQELANYIAVGYRTLILDIPPNQEELAHINVVLTHAAKEAQNGRVVTAISN